MLVRDRTLTVKDYKGRPTDASDSLCPCRPCFNAHDCGSSRSGRRIQNMECASRWNHGCPNPKPEPEHIYSGERGKVCKRCGALR